MLWNLRGYTQWGGDEIKENTNVGVIFQILPVIFPICCKKKNHHDKRESGQLKTQIPCYNVKVDDASLKNRNAYEFSTSLFPENGCSKPSRTAWAYTQRGVMNEIWNCLVSLSGAWWTLLFSIFIFSPREENQKQTRNEIRFCLYHVYLTF